VNDPQLVPRELLALALFALLLFHRRSKKAITASRPRAAQIIETQNKRSECRGARKRPAGF
jgi:hypothetical protein